MCQIGTPSFIYNDTPTGKIEQGWSKDKSALLRDDAEDADAEAGALAAAEVVTQILGL